ncbi:Alpha/beta hydrolase-3 [Melia azedarach]|uniref:Alpha/beta hydrolase-3 n=1 Tax=Melia azedarach TaxID=155640 RepID=A0ACC1YHY6_MELAZ|nr:Alpha/beta hydrolase-3 [Melia azedarach]
MDSTNSEIIRDFPSFFKMYKDGRVERYKKDEIVDAGYDPSTGIQSKDVVISSETGVKARMLIPKIKGPNQKLPLLVHYHGGGFCSRSAFDVKTKNFLTSLVSKANIIAISIDYRLAPEHLLPIAYDDSFAGLQWVATHSSGLGPDPWLNVHADFGRVFLAGESAGGTIANDVAIQAGTTGSADLKIERLHLVIVHPFFAGKERREMYKFMSPGSSGCHEDPRLNPEVDPKLKKMAGDRVLVCVSEKDCLRDGGLAYYETV